MRGYFFAPLAVLSTGVLCILTIANGLTFRSMPLRNWIIRTWGKMLLKISGVRLRVKGLENIQPGTSYVMIANHQSLFDLVVICAAIEEPMTILTKKELFYIPVWGATLRALLFVKVDRKNRKRAVESLRQAEILLREKGLSLLVFPEGTRTLDGKLLPFKKGAFVMAQSLNMPVIPIIIRGNFETMPKGSYRIRSFEVELEVLPAIAPPAKEIRGLEGYIGEVRGQMINALESASGLS